MSCYCMDFFQTHIKIFMGQWIAMIKLINFVILSSFIVMNYFYQILLMICYLKMYLLSRAFWHLWIVYKNALMSASCDLLCQKEYACRFLWYRYVWNQFLCNVRTQNHHFMPIKDWTYSAIKSSAQHQSVATTKTATHFFSSLTM